MNLCPYKFFRSTNHTLNYTSDLPFIDCFTYSCNRNICAKHIIYITKHKILICNNVSQFCNNLSILTNCRAQTKHLVKKTFPLSFRFQKFNHKTPNYTVFICGTKLMNSCNSSDSCFKYISTKTHFLDFKRKRLYNLTIYTLSKHKFF